MEAEELSGRELTIDSIMSKVRDFKNEDLTDELSLNKVSADTTGKLFLFSFYNSLRCWVLNSRPHTC
jgi:hypothetical protein